jgi:integrase
MPRQYEVVGAGRGLSTGSVHKVRNVLRVLFSFAVHNDLVAANPVSKTKIPPACSSQADSLTVEEANAFVSVKNEFWFGNAFAFQLQTGLRNQELMALIKDDVDFVNKTLRVERACKWHNGACVEVGSPKTRKSYRVIGLDDQALTLVRLQLERLEKLAEGRGRLVDEKINNWIRRYRPGVGHLYIGREVLFPWRDGRVSDYWRPRLEFKQMLRRAGVSNSQRSLRWYDLRHTHASILLTLGLPLHEIADRMGHSVEMLLEMYAHVLRGRLHAASQAFADVVKLPPDPAEV